MASLLIVDDDPTLLDVLSELFAGEHRCDTASSAEEAMATLAECDYDLIITDLSMPGLSGEALLGFARSRCPRTPVLFVSGSTDEGRARRLIAKGAFDYVQKPFQLSEVLEKVAHALEHRRRLLSRSLRGRRQAPALTLRHLLFKTDPWNALEPGR